MQSDAGDAVSPATFLNASSQPPCPTGGLTVCVCVCVVSEYRSRFTSEETVLFCLRVMVGVIILYDHVHPAGAFVKTSNIDVCLSLSLTHTLTHTHNLSQTGLHDLIWFRTREQDLWQEG